jgi:hypothetical protein
MNVSSATSSTQSISSQDSLTGALQDYFRVLSTSEDVVCVCKNLICLIEAVQSRTWENQNPISSFFTKNNFQGFERFNDTIKEIDRVIGTKIVHADEMNTTKNALKSFLEKDIQTISEKINKFVSEGSIGLKLVSLKAQIAETTKKKEQLQKEVQLTAEIATTSSGTAPFVEKLNMDVIDLKKNIDEINSNIKVESDKLSKLLTSSLKVIAPFQAETPDSFVSTLSQVDAANRLAISIMTQRQILAKKTEALHIAEKKLQEATEDLEGKARKSKLENLDAELARLTKERDELAQKVQHDSATSEVPINFSSDLQIVKDFYTKLPPFLSEAIKTIIETSIKDVVVIIDLCKQPVSL